MVSFSVILSDPLTRVLKSWYFSKANISKRCISETQLL